MSDVVWPTNYKLSFNMLIPLFEIESRMLILGFPGCEEEEDEHWPSTHSQITLWISLQNIPSRSPIRSLSRSFPNYSPDTLPDHPSDDSHHRSDWVKRPCLSLSQSVKPLIEPPSGYPSAASSIPLHINPQSLTFLILIFSSMEGTWCGLNLSHNCHIIVT